MRGMRGRRLPAVSKCLTIYCGAIRHGLAILAVAAATCFSSFAQQQPFSGTAAIEDSLQRLNELGSVLMIAAHPDDERTALLAYYARGRHMRTAYLSVTRGEGGQNLIGADKGDHLGLIRTHELLDARRIDGAEQFFTRAIDFGFSKTASETLQKWGRDRILADVVWVMRSFRPDVVILVFSGTPRDGHGHHQSSAILGKEAFVAAGDPNRFPEQLKFVQPWKPRRMVRAGFGAGRGGRAGTPERGGAQPGGRGGEGTPATPQTPPEPPPVPSGSADTGTYNPILGYSYEELAVLSRSMHHSQGTGAMRNPGPQQIQFELVAGDAASKDLFDGIDTTWNRFPHGPQIRATLTDAIRSFDVHHPEKVIPQLLQVRPRIAAIQHPTAARKLVELDEAVAMCAGLWVDAQARQPEVITGSEVTVTATVLNRSSVDVVVQSIGLEGMWSKTNTLSPPAKLGLNQRSTQEFRVEVPASQPYSQPYWLVKPATDGAYKVDDQKLIGLPEPPPVLEASIRLAVAGVPIELKRPVHFRYADRALGERDRPLVVAPPVAVNFPDANVLFPSAAPRRVLVSVKANVPKAAGELKLELPAGWKAEPQSQPFQVAIVGEQQDLSFRITPPAAETIASLRAVAVIGGREVANGMEVISYPHIPVQTLFPSSEMKLVRSDVKVTAKRVGYIMGSGDEVPEALRQMGLEVSLLTRSDLDQGDLSRFDAIVAGVRAYAVRPDLRANQQRLMAYVRDGGTYVVQYQDGAGGGPGPGGRGGQGQARGGQPQGQPAAQQQPPPPPPDRNIGPYPLTVPGGNTSRVTVEEAPVTFPHPESPLLRTPNVISQKDFEGWVQERGLYFATQWDPRYETVLASNDPGENPLPGGELWTRFGKGVYIFTAYSWFRQLPAGVPGAYRQFANLLSAK